ncbi:MAG: carboxylesterase/lipase family protein [Chitinophagales bacterium]|nr:carboxylesterase/lipase family protein [Chitinophagales bacterium]
MVRHSLLSVILVGVSFSLYAAKHTSALKTDSASLVVATAYGKLRGTTDQNVYVWKGIPFAKAPTGELRFRSPQLPEKWEGIKEATEFGASAPQMKSSFSRSEMQDENCLSLNIWSPAADGKKRPVMFWIHGGGFVVGSGSSELYNGAKLAETGDVVVVTINYRLGVLGFLYFDEKERSAGNFENNLGIRDQIAALNWVKQNIAAFGGNPEQVTIFGESAGGTSVETLLACPSARGLFKGAIAQSGPAAILWQPETAKSITEKFLATLNISSDSLHLLKLLPADSLVEAGNRLLKYMVKETPNKVFSPTIDGELLTTDIFHCLSPAQSGDVALLIGTNKDESTMFASRKLRMAPSNSKKLEKEFLHVLKPEEKERVTNVYKNYPRKRGVLDLLTDAVFRIPAIRMAECQSKHSPVYMYRFEWSSFFLNVAGLRSFHGLEIPFVFGTADGSRYQRMLKYIASKKIRTQLTAEIQTAWINFARFGNPNGNKGENWKAFDSNEYATMIFDRKSELKNDPDAIQRKAWEGVQYY